MTTPADVLNVARSYLGVTEHPPHSNRTIIGEKFGWNGVPWCAESVTVWEHEAGNTGFQGSASCLVLVSRYRDGTNGTWGVSPEPGDEGFLGARGGDHTFLIEANTGDGFVTTIEGNWGDAVTRVRRSISSIYGFGRPHYSGGGGGRPVLRSGSRGPAVTAWQQFVGPAIGQPIDVDGSFGPQTDSATRTFQSRVNLEPDGEVGPKTYAAMDWIVAANRPAPPPPPAAPAFMGNVQQGSRGTGVRVVQQRLADRGWKLRVDGDFGPATAAVVRKFQQEKGLVADGIVGPATFNALWNSPVT